MDMKKDLREILKISGIKATKRRLLILSFFGKKCRPINAEYLSRKLKGQRINEATIFRTLTSFELAGIIKKVEFREGSSYYEMQGKHHHHIVCQKCEDFEKFDVSNEKHILEKIMKSSKKFNNIKDHSIELFGICKSCAKR